MDSRLIRYPYPLGVILSLTVFVCVQSAIGGDRHPIELSDDDKAVIASEALRLAFAPEPQAVDDGDPEEFVGDELDGQASPTSERVVLLADTISPEWVPSIDGVDFVLRTYDELSALDPIPDYYTITFVPHVRSVDVRIDGRSIDPYVDCCQHETYRFHRHGGQWRGKRWFLFGP